VSDGGPEKVRIGLRLTKKAYQQLMALADTYNQSPSAVIARAIATAYNDDPLVRGKVTKKNKRPDTSTNGADKQEGTG
jgi:hypothetical protein